MNTPQLTLGQIVGAILQHKFKVMFVFALVMLSVTALFLIWPRNYGSEGRLYVQFGRQDADVSPTVSGAGVSIQDTRETEIRSVMEIIKSRAVVESVVDTIGADRILESPLDDLIPSIGLPKFLQSKGGPGDEGISSEEYSRLKVREQAAEKLSESMVVHSEKKTSVISVWIKASSPKLAQQLVEEVFEETKRIHLEVHAVKGSAVFFEGKIRDSELALEDATKQLEDFRNESGFLSVGQARQTLQDILDSLEKDLMSSELELAQTTNTIKQLRQEMSATEPLVAINKTGIERKSGDDARLLVFNLESERERLLSSYRPGHPDVVRIDEQLRKVRGKLGGMSDNRIEKEMALNPMFEAVKVQLVQAEAQQAGAEARLVSLQEKFETSRGRLVALNKAEVKSDKLQRNIDIARRDFELYIQKGIETKAHSSLDQSNISGLVVAQHPNFVVKHVSPKGSMFLPIGAMLGLLCGLATALFCERNHLSASLNEGEVEQILEMPVLVTLPRVYSSRNMVN